MARGRRLRERATEAATLGMGVTKHPPCAVWPSRQKAAAKDKRSFEQIFADAAFAQGYSGPARQWTGSLDADHFDRGMIARRVAEWCGVDLSGVTS